MKPEPKKLWLKQLSQFIVEANKETWAADKGEIAPLLPHHETHEYRRGPWKLVDDYSAYFRAPGITWVSFQDQPVWHMYYGGIGMVESQYHLVNPAFEFLREALMLVPSDIPVRGPSKFQRDDWQYTFSLTGNMEDGKWVERITKDNILIFEQEGSVGMYIAKDTNEKPIYPWEI